MAILIKPLLGDLSGKVGESVSARVNGRTIVKSPPTKRTAIQKAKPPLSQHIALRTIGSFLKLYSEVIDYSFPKKHGKLTAWSQAVKYNLEKAVKFIPGAAEINFAKVRLSKGNRETAWAAQLRNAEGSDGIILSWEVPESAKMKVIGKDKAIAVLYNEKTKQGSLFSSALREDLSLHLKLSSNCKGQPVHVWLFFQSPDGKEVSNTDYAGLIIPGN